jgi:transcriptional regulator with XRE-family HTH domain
MLLWNFQAEQPVGTSEISKIDRHIADKLKHARLSRNMSQQELAARLGITFQQVQKYEKGQNRVSSSRLYEISKIMDVDFSYFVNDIEQHASSAPESVSERENMKYLKAIKKLDNQPEKKQKIIKILCLLIDCLDNA